MTLSREAKEARRLEAAVLLENGFRPAEVARRYSVSRTTTSRWAHAFEQHGVDGLKLHKAPGRPRRYDWRANAEMIRTLYVEAGHPTFSAFAALLSERLDVRYSRDHLGRILHEICAVNDATSA